MHGVAVSKKSFCETLNTHVIFDGCNMKCQKRSLEMKSDECQNAKSQEKEKCNKKRKH